MSSKKGRAKGTPNTGGFISFSDVAGMSRVSGTGASSETSYFVKAGGGQGATYSGSVKTKSSEPEFLSPVYSGSDSGVSVVMKKLLKKDATTR